MAIFLPGLVVLIPKALKNLYHSIALFIHRQQIVNVPYYYIDTGYRETQILLGCFKPSSTLVYLVLLC